MHLSRRRFFGAAAASAIAVPLTNELLAFAEPQRMAAAGGREGEIILNSNENAYGPFPSVMKAMQDGLRYANRYPDSHFDALWEAIARTHNASKEQIFLGCGSTDILRMAAECFTGPDRPLITATPTFEALVHYAKRNKAPVTQIPLRTSDYAHDLEKMLAAASSAPSLVYICNPNNPTASLTPRAEIEQFLQKLPQNAHVIIDEAYHHFVTDPNYRSFAERPIDDPRVIVARTFSKVFGMAGMRVGYAVAHPQTIEKLGEHYVYDNPNVVGAIGATAGLNDQAGLKAASQRIISDREAFIAAARKRNLKLIPSQANFIMFDSGRPVRQAIEFFAKQNVRIGRPFPPYETHVRVSLGTPTEMQTFWRVWDQYLS
jgi:histidinol-phosphate aminotransferase